MFKPQYTAPLLFYIHLFKKVVIIEYLENKEKYNN